MASRSSPTSERAGSKEERRARSLANLEKNKIKKGEVRNKLGKNGRERSGYIVGILDELDKGEPRIRKVILAAYKRALRGSDPAAKFLGEQYGGKARQLIDLTSSDRSMSPNRKPTTAEARQEVDRILATMDSRSSGAETAADEVAAAAAGEPKAGS